MKQTKWFVIGLAFGLILCTVTKENHECHEKEYQKAFLDCKIQVDKARAIIKGDSLHTLVYW
jgi:hypothetical protein